MYSVVIIDDNKATAERIAKTVPWDKYDCVVRAVRFDGDTGKQAVENIRPDLIITDIYMPGQDGIELIETTRELVPNAQIIFISAYEDFSNARRAIKLNAHDYLLKPFSQEELISTVQGAVKILNTGQTNKSIYIGSINVSGFSPIIRQMIQYLYDNIERAPELEELAAKFNMSISHTGRTIQKSVGMTFRELQTKLRIERAKVLLRDTNICVEEIANMVGYKNYTTLYKVFHAEEQMAPSEYRKKVKED